MVPARSYFHGRCAARRGLDFIAICDHFYAALQPRGTTPCASCSFTRQACTADPGRRDRPSRDIFNFFGDTIPGLPRLGSTDVPDMNVCCAMPASLERSCLLLSGRAERRDLHGLRLDSCDGGRGLLDAVEVVNGGTEDPAFSGIPVLGASRGQFWPSPIAIGGSDNPSPFIPLDQPGSDRRPGTVVTWSWSSRPPAFPWMASCWSRSMLT